MTLSRKFSSSAILFFGQPLLPRQPARESKIAVILLRHLKPHHFDKSFWPAPSLYPLPISLTITRAGKKLWQLVRRLNILASVEASVDLPVIFRERAV